MLNSVSADGGDLLFSAGSIYADNVDASGNAVRLAVNGKSALQGAILEIVAANGSYGARTLYTVLTATGGILGSSEPPPAISRFSRRR